MGSVSGRDPAAQTLSAALSAKTGGGECDGTMTQAVRRTTKTPRWTTRYSYRKIPPTGCRGRSIFRRSPLRGDMVTDKPEYQRKKPVQARAAYTLSIIHETVAHLLEQLDVRKLTTNRVAERAGYSIGTLYSYFPSKSALIRATLLHELDKTEAAAVAALDAAPAGPVDELVRAAVRVGIGMFARRHGARKKILLFVVNDERIVARGLATVDRISEMLAEAIRAKADPPVRELSETARFLLVRAAVGGLRAAVYSRPELLETPEFEDELVRLLVRFLEHPPTSLPRSP
jgi:AcrR family transcriptional regulator